MLAAGSGQVEIDITRDWFVVKMSVSLGKVEEDSIFGNGNVQRKPRYLLFALLQGSVFKIFVVHGVVGVDACLWAKPRCQGSAPTLKASAVKWVDLGD